jgi:hypothetical protein
MENNSLPSFDEDNLSESLAENQLYDFINNQPVKDTPVERVLQVVARSLVDEYEFDHTQLQRDHTVLYEVFDEHNKTSKVRRKIDIAVFAEGANRDDQAKIIRACIVQAPALKPATHAREFTCWKRCWAGCLHACLACGPTAPIWSLSRS